MKRTPLIVPAFIFIATLNLLPVALILKQAFTPESESFAWPPTWSPHEWTLVNFRSLSDAVDLSAGLTRSLLVAVLTSLSCLALALPPAWRAARTTAVDRALDGTMIVTRLFPSLALAVPLASLFVQVGLYNHPAALGLWLAHTLLGVPFAFFILRNGFRAVPRDLEEAALLDGASPFDMFRRILLPVVRPSMGAAAILVFLVSWDEFAFALLLQVTNRTLPPLVYYLSAFGYPGMASAVAAIMMIPAILIIVILEPALRSGALSGSGR